MISAVFNTPLTDDPCSRCGGHDAVNAIDEMCTWCFEYMHHQKDCPFCAALETPPKFWDREAMAAMVKRVGPT